MYVLVYELYNGVFVVYVEVLVWVDVIFCVFLLVEMLEDCGEILIFVVYFVVYV